MKNLILLWLLVFQLNIAFADLCDLAPEALKAAEQIRGLKILRPVPCKVKSKEQVLASLHQIIDREVTPEKIINEELLFKKIGILPADFKYKEGMIELYTSQLAGFYDQIEEYYAMAGWMPEVMQEPIAVHELVHALQDQHYNLDNFVDSKKLKTDEALARSAVAEGDATLVTNDYLTRITGKSLMKDTKNVSSYVAETVLGSKMMPDFAKAPESLQAMLLFPYTSGLVFAHSVIKGKDYTELNQLYTNPPKTTSQILHPEKYQSSSEFKALTLEDLKRIFQLELSEDSYTDRIGEFLISTILPADKRKLATHWKNDLAVITAGKVYWLTEWSADQQAKEFAEILKTDKELDIEKSLQKGSRLLLIFM